MILEPETGQPPEPGYFAGLRELCDAHEVLLILDETITGFRWHVRGAQFVYGIEPDLSVFGKGLASGHAIGLVISHHWLTYTPGNLLPGYLTSLDPTTTVGSSEVPCRPGNRSRCFGWEPVIASGGPPSVSGRCRDGS